MIDFDLFVKTLGPYAKHYTPDQLKQLHLEVKKLADVLLAVRTSKISSRQNQFCPQPVLDGTQGDRTLEMKGNRAR